MKRILAVIIVVSIILTGCSKVVSERKIEDNAEVVGVDYRRSYVTTSMIMSGKVLVPITTTHPARYEVVVRYDGVEFELNDEKAYDMVKNSIGKIKKCRFREKSYDDGTIKRELEEITEE